MTTTGLPADTMAHDTMTGDATTDADEVSVALAGEELAAALEAILLVVDQPTSELDLASALGVSQRDVAQTLHALASRFDHDRRGIDLRQVAEGWRFYTRSTYAPYVERFVRDARPARLSQAALETLAVIAYRQPVTRARIAAVRGVNVDAVVRTLVYRQLIGEAGVEPVTGAILYSTTRSKPASNP